MSIVAKIKQAYKEFKNSERRYIQKGLETEDSNIHDTESTEYKEYVKNYNNLINTLDEELTEERDRDDTIPRN